ncbi:hypothetical protein F5Y06DRAFT_301206 [Hypoxylon sp. FL0890]|nr:hypothetical protein F5Y06DRAFT_301206 [Hypoxylon sp. FL0890]
MSHRRVSHDSFESSEPESKVEKKSTTPPTSPPKDSSPSVASKCEEITPNFGASTMTAPAGVSQALDASTTTQSVTDSPGVSREMKQCPGQDDSKLGSETEAGSQPSTKEDPESCQQSGSSNKEAREEQPKSQ